MHLAEVYAKDLGVKVGTPQFTPHFFPCTFESYITIHNGNKVPSKEYSYWRDVIRIIKPELQSRGIKICQIGTPEESQIHGVDARFNTGTLKQAGFLIQGSLLHVGIDSVPVHLASSLDIPSVSIYAHTYMGTCSPLWNKNSKAITLESHRDGNKPSFSLTENPKTIDLIKPEQVASAIFEQLNIVPSEIQKTLFIGDKYNHQCVDVILNEPVPVLLPENSVIRMDLIHNEKYLKDLLSRQNERVLIKTIKPINKETLNLYRDKIAGIVYFTNSFNPKFVEEVKLFGIQMTLVCSDINELKKQRIKFIDYEVNHFDEKAFIESKKKEIKQKIKGDVQYNTDKFYLVGNKKILNLAEVKKICGLKYTDDDFFIDSDHMMIYITNKL